MVLDKSTISKKSESKLYELSIGRSIIFFNAVGLIHIFLLNLDLYNGLSGVWEKNPYQYYLFLNHLISIPVLFSFSRYLQHQIDIAPITKKQYRKLIGFSVIVFLPIIMTYHYVEIITSHSGSALVIYVLGYGLSLNLDSRIRICLTLYFLFAYFTFPIYLEQSYADHPYLFMIGLGLTPFFYLISRSLNKSEVIRFINEEAVEDKNKELDQLNQKLKEANLNIQTINQTLKTSNKNLSDFASIAAHDIKAPMRTIGSFSNLLTKKYRNKIAHQDLEYFDFINENVKSLSEMIDKLLKFSKVSVEADIKYEAVDLNKLLHSCILLLEHPIKVYNAELNIPVNLPTINGDEYLLKQLFLNLLNNAIKYSKNALPKPIISINFKQVQNSQIEVSIKDNGIGISKENHQNIFELFRMLNAPADFEGNGIGLALCKRIVHAHKGKISVKSEYQKGAEFIFSIGNIPIPSQKPTATVVALEKLASRPL